MVNEPQSSDLVDPLHDHYGLSLFPRTFRDSANAPKPNDPDDLESIHNFMKSMALRSPDKLLEKAKAITDGGSQLLNSNFASFVASGNINEAVATECKENPQERRPGLGRKRARFSLKPNTIEPSVNLEPTLDIDQLQDPEQYFLAHEMLENAKKELQRLRGGSKIDLNEYNPSTNAQRRRPGILGYQRKSVSYKHQYSSVLPENDDTFISSQETLEQDILSPSNYDLEQETTDPSVEMQEKELAGSMAKTNNRVSVLLDELLSSNGKNLDGDGALSLLQERLQIKPIDLEKLCLPDFHDIGKIDFMALGEKLPKPRNPLSDIQNLVKGISGKTPVKHKQVAVSPVHHPASPTPPISPLASISFLEKPILRSNPSSDPFSALNSVLSPVTNSFFAEHVDNQSDQVHTKKESSISGKLRSLVGGEITNTTVANMGPQKMITGSSIEDDNSSRLGVGIDFGPSESRGNLENHDRSKNTDDRVMDDSLSRPDVQTNGPSEMEVEENVEDMRQEAVSSAQPHINIEDSTRPYTDTDVQTCQFSEMKENVEDLPQEAVSSAQPDINIEDSRIENLNISQSQLGSIANTENRVSVLLDELLCSNGENLDGDGALSLLQEHLQIKPINLDKLCRPDFHNIGKTDFMALREKLPKPHNPLPDIQNLVKGISGQTPVKHKQVAESPVHHLASPTPLKSPFASISLLKKRISRSNPSSDPFSALNSDLSPATNSFFAEHVDNQSDQVHTKKELSISDKLKSLVGDEITNTAVANTGPQKMITGGSIEDDNSSRLDVGIDFGPSGSRGNLENHDRSKYMDDSLSRPDVRTNGPSEMEVEENVEEMRQEAVSSAQPDINIQDSRMENLNISQSQLDQSNPAAVEDHDMDGPSTTPHIGPEKHIEEHPRISLNQRSKAKRLPREGHQRKALSHRNSLAEAGTSLKSGLRRSTRIKMRPLEYWKGERFLYGRIHESLATVIGLKYISPAKGDGKPNFRVKSYVSDTHKELVELAALH